MPGLPLQLKKKGDNHAKSDKERIQEKLKKIEERKQLSGSRKHKRLQQYSDKFNRMFSFFLQSYRSGILDFCGSSVEVKFNPDGDDGKFGFRRFENGEIKIHDLNSRHSNVLRGVIIGKKGWGLWLDQWTDGIVECSFTRNEILKQFNDNGIVIPESLLQDFDNTILKKKLKKYMRDWC